MLVFLLPLFLVFEDVQVPSFWLLLHMSSGQHFWEAQRTWIPYKDCSRGHDIISGRYP